MNGLYETEVIRYFKQEGTGVNHVAINAID